MEMIFCTPLPHAAPEDALAWHRRPGALRRLLPPWIRSEVLSLEEGGRAVLRIRGGPISFEWTLRIESVEGTAGFRVEQIHGPFAAWRLRRLFLPEGDGGCRVEDTLEVEPPLGAAGKWAAPALLRREHSRVFAFQHLRLSGDLALHARYASFPRRTLAVTGSGGLIGGELSAFLTSGGHRVIRMVRNPDDVSGGRIHWDPLKGVIDAEGLARCDAVVHLAGAPIAEGRWTAHRKREIRNSRILGTDLLARTLAALEDGPKVLLSGSAVGFYGDRGSEMLDEESGPGRGFLSQVTQDWEAATRPAARAGIRVVRLRTGIVLSGRGGALAKMLPPFKMGVGGRLGSGRQYMSWIALDDVLGLILHALATANLEGALNLTAPHPVTNATFTTILGDVLNRPTVLPVPALAVKTLFGELGSEALLGGQRVLPRKALESGYDFAFEGLEEALRFELGRSAGKGWD